MPDIANLSVAVLADTSQAETSLSGFSDTLHSAGVGALALGGAMTAGITLPLAGIATAAVSTAVDYQASMNMLQAVTGATAAEMDALGTLAQQLGADITLPGTSAADAAIAMLELSKAGLSVTDTMGAARGVLQLSAAAQIDNATAAQITANALNSFGLAGTDAVRIADLLAASANASSGTITDTALALQQVSAVAASAGIPIEDVVTAIAEMANAGIKGSDAGTSLKTMFLALLAPTDAAKTAMAALGLSVYDASGTMKPFPQLIDEFSKALSPLSQAQQEAALKTIFGTDALRAAHIVIGDGLPKYAALKDSLTQGGDAANLAGTQMKGLGGAVQGFQSAAETFLLQAAMPFLGTLEGIVRGATDLIGAIGNLPRPVLDAAIAFGAVLAAAGPVIAALGAILLAVSAIGAGPLAIVIAGVLAFATAAAALAANVGGLRDALQPLAEGLLSMIGQEIGILGGIANDAFNRLLIPAFQAVMSLLGQVAGVFGIHLPAVQDILKGTAGAFNDFNQTIIAAIYGIANVVAQAWPNISQIIVGGANFIVNTAWPAIQSFITNVSQGFTFAMGVVKQAIDGDWAGAWSRLSAVVGAAWGVLSPILSQLGSNLLTWIGQQVPPILARFQEWGQAFATWVSGTAWPALQAALGPLIANHIAWIQQQAPVILAKLQEWGRAFGDWVSGTAWPALLAKVGELRNNLLDWLVLQVPALLENLKVWGGAFATWVETAIPPMLTELRKIADRVITWITEQLPHLADQLKTWGNAFLDWLDAPKGEMDGRMEALLGAIGSFIADAAPKIGLKLLEWAIVFSGEANGWLMGEALPKLLLALGQFLLELGTWIAFEAAPRINQKLFELGVAMVGGILGGIGSLKDQLFAAIESAIAGAIEDIRAWLGISSPSQYFFDAIGLPIGEGIVAGVIAGLAGLVEGVKGILSQLTDLAGGILGGIGDVLGGAIGSAASVVFGPIANMIATPINAQIAGWGAAIRTAIEQQTTDLMGNINANTGVVSGYLSDILSVLGGGPGPGGGGTGNNIEINVYADDETFVEKVIAVLSSIGLSRATA